MIINCVKCGKPQDLPVTADEITRWQISGDLIQKYFPNLTAGQREMLISGVCDPCFAELFEADDEESANLAVSLIWRYGKS